MLYHAAREALARLVQEAHIKAGKACLVFDVDRSKASPGPRVTHASFATDASLQLGTTEYLVHVEVPESKSVGLAVMAAAINAVNELNWITDLSAEERGVPSTKGLMYLYGHDRIHLEPYSEDVLGFVHEGRFIINPLLSPDRSTGVDPVNAYGFSEVPAKAGDGRILERRHEGGGKLRLAIAKNGFAIDRYDDSNRRIASAFSSELPDTELGAWMERMPESFRIHRDTWRLGFERLIKLEPESHRPDQDEKGFWRHELRAFDFAYSELDLLSGVQLQPDSDWAERLPHDFLSHRGSWRSAMQRLVELESSPDEKEFWQGQLQALDTAYAQLDEVLAAIEPQPMAPECS